MRKRVKKCKFSCVFCSAILTPINSNKYGSGFLLRTPTTNHPDSDFAHLEGNIADLTEGNDGLLDLFLVQPAENDELDLAVLEGVRHHQPHLVDLPRLLPVGGKVLVEVDGEVFLGEAKEVLHERQRAHRALVRL
jgi:hypothetical protein